MYVFHQSDLQIPLHVLLSRNQPYLHDVFIISIAFFNLFFACLLFIAIPPIKNNPYDNIRDNGLPSYKVALFVLYANIV